MSAHRPPFGTRPSASRKVKALLAGGLVLGIGAAITLAAWNDSEWATGSFAAGTFNIEGTVDNSTWAEHATEPAKATLSFSTGFDNLSASATVSAPFAIRLDKDTTSDATVAVQSATGDGTAETHLTYEIVQVAAWDDCTPSAAGTAQIVPAGTALDAVTGASTFSLTKSTNVGTDPGAAVYICIQVTADSSLVQSTTATGTWQFQATSS